MLVIVSDLDGTLLDSVSYSFAPAAATLERLGSLGVPLVFCSSKTGAEIEALMARLGLDHPFISENGGGIYVPPGYFPRGPGGRPARNRVVIDLGAPYADIVSTLRDVAAAQRVNVRGFADMSVADVASECRLSGLEAQLAKLREYDEPFRILDHDAGTRSRFLHALSRRGLRIAQGGRYFHAVGGTDKGHAVSVLRGLFAGRGRVVLAGLGNDFNDVSMLRAVDVPVIVRNEVNGATPRLLRKVPTAVVTDAPGPAGWASAVSGLLDRWEAGLVGAPLRLRRA